MLFGRAEPNKRYPNLDHLLIPEPSGWAHGSENTETPRTQSPPGAGAFLRQAAPSPPAPLPWGEGGRRTGEGSVANRTALLGGRRLLAMGSQCSLALLPLCGCSCQIFFYPKVHNFACQVERNWLI